MGKRQFNFSIEKKKGKGYMGIVPHKKTLKLVKIMKKYFVGIPRPWYRKWGKPSKVAVLYSITKGNRSIEIYKHHEDFDKEHHVVIDPTHNNNVKRSTNYIPLDIDYLQSWKLTKNYQEEVRLELNLNNDVIVVKIPEEYKLNSEKQQDEKNNNLKKDTKDLKNKRKVRF